MLHAVAGLIIVGFSIAHVFLLLWLQVQGTQEGIVNWPAVLAPAALTLLILPSSARFWRRWVVMYFVVFVCNPALFVYVLPIVETYVLFSIWVRDLNSSDLTSLWRGLKSAAGTLRKSKSDDSSPVGGDEETDTVVTTDGRAKKADARVKTGPTPKRPKPRKKDRAYSHA